MVSKKKLIKLFGIKIYYKINKIEAYKPNTDSFLLLKYSLIYAKGRVLEVGCGSGIITVFLSKLEKVEEVYAIDIDKDAVLITLYNCIINNCWKKVNILTSNLLSKVTKEFNLIVFNPPYLPEDEYIGLDRKVDIWTIGGKDGIELSIEFIKQAINYLKKDGKIVVILSSRSNVKKFLEFVTKEGLKYKVLEKKYVGNFEYLLVILIEK